MEKGEKGQTSVFVLFKLYVCSDGWQIKGKAGGSVVMLCYPTIKHDGVF